MKIIGSLAVALVLALAAPSARAMTSIGDAVEVRIETDSGSAFPLYPAASGAASRRVYAEAVKGAQYRIVVRNRLDRRVGLVVAVDGRNIISGKKSWLKNTERMYILEPYGSGEYSGWRTGDDRVNRFFFTSTGDSYAAAFGDRSAMGVIAVAAYPEQIRYEERATILRKSAPAPSAAPPAAAGRALGDRLGKSARRAEKAEEAGTGYGQEEYSPVVTVFFSPEAEPLEKVFVKYEWRETLCRKGVISCGKRPKNRFWYEDGYAPPPPNRG